MIIALYPTLLIYLNSVNTTFLEEDTDVPKFLTFSVAVLKICRKLLLFFLNPKIDAICTFYAYHFHNTKFWPV